MTPLITVEDGNLRLLRRDAAGIRAEPLEEGLSAGPVTAALPTAWTALLEPDEQAAGMLTLVDPRSLLRIAVSRERLQWMLATARQQHLRVTAVVPASLLAAAGITEGSLLLEQGERREFLRFAAGRLTEWRMLAVDEPVEATTTLRGDQAAERMLATLAGDRARPVGWTVLSGESSHRATTWPVVLALGLGLGLVGGGEVYRHRLLRETDRLYEQQAEWHQRLWPDEPVPGDVLASLQARAATPAPAVTLAIRLAGLFQAGEGRMQWSELEIGRATRLQGRELEPGALKACLEQLRSGGLALQAGRPGDGAEVLLSTGEEQP